MGDADKIANKWVTHNAATLASKTTTDERNSARAWTELNVQLNTSSLNNVMEQVYGSGWAFGQQDAFEKMGADIADPWANWNPGNESAAALVDAPRGLQSLLEARGTTISGIDQTTMDRLGSALASSLSQGHGAVDTARAVNYVLNDPARALIIARTETARALVQANVDQYRSDGVEFLEWLVADPCEDCQQNDGEVVAVGEEFPSGDEYPPAHPNCVCDVAPVMGENTAPVDDVAGVDNAPDVEQVSVEGNDTVIHDGVVNEIQTPESSDPIANTKFVDGQWTELTPEQKFDVEFLFLRNLYKSSVTDERIKRIIASDKKSQRVIQKSLVLKNGETYIRVQTSYKFTEPMLNNLKTQIEKLQSITPKQQMVVSVTGIKAYGQAIRGDSTIELDYKKIFAPTEAELISQAREGVSGWKMPSVNDVEKLQYTLTHEWGHASENILPNSHLSADSLRQYANAKIKELHREHIAQNGQGFVSNYGLTKPEEMYAELFTEWTLTRGMTTNPLVQTFAKEFDWKK